MPSIRLSLIIMLALFLSSCAYVVEKSFQDVTVLTPGAQGALCMVDIDGLFYEFRPPETIAVTKSSKDMIVDCKAPGNRRKKIVVESDISALSVAGGPLAAWDYASEAMFKYPDVVEVDFTNIPVTEMPLPAQNNPDIKQPEEYYLEEFRPSNPRLNSDRFAPEIQLERRNFGEEENVYYPDYGTPGDDNAAASSNESQPSSPPAFHDKGNLMSVKQAPVLTAPSTEPYGPAQLYPVE